MVGRSCELYARLKQAMRRAGRARPGARRLCLARRRVLTDPARALRDLHRRLDDLARAGCAPGVRAQPAAAPLTAWRWPQTPCVRCIPWLGLPAARRVLAQLRGRLVAAGGAQRRRRRGTASTAAVGRLESLSPLAVLGRGYSLTRLPSGAVVRSAAEVARGRRHRDPAARGRARRARERRQGAG